MKLNFIKSIEIDSSKYFPHPEYHKSLDELLAIIEDTASKEEWQKFYEISDTDTFAGTGGPMWFHRRNEMTPQLGRAIYQYSDAYAKGWSSFTHDASIFPEGNCMDFGAGLGDPWNNMRNLNPHTNLHLIELSDGILIKLKERYEKFPNVFIHQNLSEVKDLKFKYIYSHEVLGHVRNINEHLWVLYKLCEMGGTLDLTIEDPGDECGGHVIEQYPDTKKRPPFLP